MRSRRKEKRTWRKEIIIKPMNMGTISIISSGLIGFYP